MQATPSFAGSYDVEVDGVVVNNASAEISVTSVSVSVPGISYPLVGFVNGFRIPAGGTATWKADGFVSSGPPPSTATAKIDYASWSGIDFIGCPT